LRLGVYADLVYRRDGDVVSSELAFIDFVTALAPRLTELVIFGRLDPRPGRFPHVLPRERVRFVALPHYARVTSVAGLLRARSGSRRAFLAEVDRLDAAWLFGPHPLALEFAVLCRRRRKPIVLGIRQDFPQYIRNRLPSRRWLWALGVAHALEQTFRTLARRLPTVVVGEDLGRKYSGGPAPVLVTGFSLVRESELVPLAEALAKPWSGDLRLLSVGRLDSEKNPLLLAAILAGLRARDGRWRLSVVGSGPLAGEVERRAAELGVADSLELLGYLGRGPALHERYRSSHVFLHVSLTEGLPQVLYEAQAAGLAIVATDVGGVAAALGGGALGLLVPPNNAEAAVEAVERLSRDVELRHRLVAAGLQQAAHETIDRQHDRLEAFVRAAAERRR
jgi:glycosyltransferase involved in cell wall biosynthesis